jgi:hypothetical protein
MTCMLKGREMKRLKAALKASAIACIMPRTLSIVLCVKEVGACSRQDGSDGRRRTDDAPRNPSSYPLCEVRRSRKEVVEDLSLGRLPHSNNLLLPPPSSIYYRCTSQMSARFSSWFDMR